MNGRTGIPRLDVTIPKGGLPAVQEDSGRCLIVEAIKLKYGPASRPIVDMSYITMTIEKGVRASYRTPINGKAVLLDFDHGILPAEDIHIVASVAHVRERPSRASAGRVRQWAKTQPEYAEAVPDNGPVSDRIIAAFEAAHPKTKVEQGTRVRPGADRHTARPVTTSQSSPPTGALPGGAGKIPSDRRRTFGERKLTAEMISRGWTPPGSG